MSLTLDPEVAQALAPMAAPAADQTPAPIGDALTRRTVQDRILAEVCDALPMPDDITMTDYHATAPDGAQIPMRWSRSSWERPSRTPKAGPPRAAS